MRPTPRTPNPRTSRPGARPLVVVATVVAALVAGCGWADPGGGGDDGGTTLRVLAASSLTDVFEELAEVFEDEHPGVEVELSFGSSTDLAEQAADGAPADVLATADEASMEVAARAGVVHGYGPLATNRLVLVTPPDDPAGVESLADLAGATWVRCADEAPCGKVALEVLADSGVDAEPASLEEDARSTLDKVVSGEADAALVYASDARSAGADVATIRIPGSGRHRTTYFIGSDVPYVAGEEPQAAAGSTVLAQEFLALALGKEGRRLLADAGFGLP